MPILNISINEAQDDAWLTGDVADNVATLDIIQRDGKVKTVASREGFVLAPIPAGPGAVKEIIGRDAKGAQVGNYEPKHYTPPGG